MIHFIIYWKKLEKLQKISVMLIFPMLGANLCLILDAENQLFRIMAHGHSKKFVPLWAQIVVNNLKIKDIMLRVFFRQTVGE